MLKGKAAGAYLFALYLTAVVVFLPESHPQGLQGPQGQQALQGPQSFQGLQAPQGPMDCELKLLLLRLSYGVLYAYALLRRPHATLSENTSPR